MTAPWYSSPEPAEPDYLFPDGEPTVKVRVKCGCGFRSIGLFISEVWLMYLRRGAAAASIPPEAVIAAHWCRGCKSRVKVTAKDLHIA